MPQPTDPSSHEISALLIEERTFPPSAAFTAAAHANDPAVYDRAAGDPEAFWAGFANELEWITPFTRVLEWASPDAKWFGGGRLNVAANCLDRHVRTARRNKAAIIWEGEPGDRRTLTYFDLHRDVNAFAHVLRGLGVKKGDRVALYMPLVPELAIAMLACARLGAVHNVVFGGFSSESLRDRINDSQCSVLVTADGGYRRGQLVPLKQMADEALTDTPSIRHVVVVQRDQTARFPVHIHEGRDHWYHRLMQEAGRQGVEPEPMDAEDMLYILYTSGTTGKPKGIVHTTAGYLVGCYATTKWVFDMKDEDVYWCTADIGWVTGHSYVVYGPLANGATVVMYEGAPDWPDKARFWQIVERYGVTIFYTAPTAIRAFMRWGTEHPETCDLSSLRVLGSVGEPINPEAWMWYHKAIGGERCPIVDTWWQTETGHIMISPLPGITETKPGSATVPLPGIDAAVLDESTGEEVQGKQGLLVLRKPWPGMLRTLYKDDDRFIETYWDRFGRDTYLVGDAARIDADGYFWVIGRIDDVLNVSGHRMSTAEIESAVVSHRRVAECAVIGQSDEDTGQAVCAFVTLEGKESEGSDELVEEIREVVAVRIGKFARPKRIIWSADLPKTRSGKIMRRLLRDIAEGRELGDVTTLRDPAVMKELEGKFGSEDGGE
jgi:acetyl-CoA synthetase